METTGLVQILEGALMAAGEPLSLRRLSQLFDDLERPADADLRAALEEAKARCEGRGYELIEVASGYRFQVRQNLSTWVGRLWEERPQKYSRALLETLSLIAYRQPITRGEIEEIRGVAVSTNIIKTLQEREWVRIVGHRDVPGRPAMYATTRQFLDYFGLKSLEDLPALAEIKELDSLSGDLPLEVPPEASNDPSIADASTAGSEAQGADVEEGAEGAEGADGENIDVQDTDLRDVESDPDGTQGATVSLAAEDHPASTEDTASSDLEATATHASESGIAEDSGSNDEDGPRERLEEG